MADTFITPDIIAKEALFQLENNLVLGMNVHRQYVKEFAKVGDTVRIRRPVKFETNDGADITSQIQDVEEANDNIKLTSRKNVAWDFLTQDLTLKIEQYSERYIQPAMITLAQTIDRDGHKVYRDVWNQVGTAGTPPASFANMALSSQRLDEMAVPPNPRKAILDPAAGWKIAGAQIALYMQDVAKQAYRQGAVGEIAGLQTFRSQNVATHTVGVNTGTPLVNGASQNVTYANAGLTLTDGRVFKNAQTLNTDGWTNSTTGILKAGDVFTLAGVYAVNPVPGDATDNKMVMTYLQQFTVLEDADSGASTGPAALKIAPAIITDGPYQTVSAAPADGAAVTVVGTGGSSYKTNLVYHPNAFALVTVPLAMPDGAVWKARRTHKGISLRVIKAYDVILDREIVRLDVLYGWKAIYPDLATRHAG